MMNRMKNKLTVLGALLAPLAANAATIGTWNPAASPGDDGWTVNVVGNAGSFYPGNPASNGGSSNPSPLPDSSWGFWSSGGSVTATWEMVGGALAVGQSVTIGFDNGWIPDGSVVSLAFGSGGNAGITWSFTGGQANYQVADASGVTTTDQGWTDFGMYLTLTLTGAGTYSFEAAGDTVNYSTTGTFANSLASIDQLVFFTNNSEGGNQRDVFLGDITVVPEPSSSALLGGLLLLGLLRRRR